MILMVIVGVTIHLLEGCNSLFVFRERQPTVPFRPASESSDAQAEAQIALASWF